MHKTLMRLILAAGLVLAASSAAHADPIITPFLVTTFLISTELASVITFVALTAVSVGISYLAKALTPKPSTPDISSLPGGTTGKLQTGGVVPRSFIVGISMTGGSLAYANAYGSDSAITAAAALGKTTAAGGNTPNAYLVEVIPLSDIPVHAMASLIVNGVTVTWTGAVGSFEGVAIPEFNKDGKDYLWVRFYDGTQVAADPELVQLFSADPDRPYTSARKGSGIAYAVVTALVNQDLFPGFPQCKFVLNGIHLYDRRRDSSVGGFGDQRWDTPSTWELTENPIVIAENILRGISYAGKWVYGAQTVTTTQLPFASWTAASSECDDGPIVSDIITPQFIAGGEIRFDQEPAATLEELLKSCNGKLAEIGGSYKIRAGAAGSAVFSFTDGDILSTEQQTFDPFPSLGQTVNAVTAKYVSPADGFTPKDAPPLYDSALEAADGGRRQAVDVNYSFVTSGEQVQRLMKSARNEQRAFRHHALPMPPDAFVLEPLDVISWTSTRNGYVSKLFDIISADDLPNLNMGLAIREIDPNAYDWVAEDDEQPIADGRIVIVRPPPQSVVDWNAIAWTINSDDGRQLPAIKLSWDTGSVDVSGIKYEVRIAATLEEVLAGSTDRYNVGSIIISANLIGNTAYEVRGQYIPTSVRDVTWSDWLAVTTPDIKFSVEWFDSILNDAIANVEASADDLLAMANALIVSLLAGKTEVDTRQIQGTYHATNVSNQVDGEKSARILVQDLLIAQLNDPTTGLSTRASASDVTALETLTADGDHGNLALAVRSTDLETTVNDGTTGVAANYSHVTALLALTDDATHGNLALATDVTTLSAQMDDVSASETFKAVASAGVGGALAVVDLYVAASNAGTFTKAGLQLAAYVDASGNPFSRSQMYADQNEIAIPGVAGGDPVSPWQVQLVNGTSKIALVSNIFADKSIQTRALADGALGLLSKATSPADVTRTITSWHSSGSGNTVLGVTITADAGSSLLIDFNTIVDQDVWDASAAHGWFKLVVNGSTIRQFSVDAPFTWDNANSIHDYRFQKFPFSLRELVTALPGGATTVAVTFERDADGVSSGNITMTTPQFFIEEKKNPTIIDVATTITPSVTYQTAIYNGASGTFTATAIGSADANRIVVVALGWRANTSNNATLTIGGAAANPIGHTIVAGSYNLQMFELSVPSGTTADIVATIPQGGSPAASDIHIAVWKVVASNHAPTTAATNSNYDPTSSTYQTSTLIGLYALSGEVGIVAVIGDSGISGFTGTWSGSDTPTERVDTTGGTIRRAAYDIALTQTGSKTFTVSEGSGTKVFTYIGALWQ